jgi:hypothetical protein
MVTHSNKALKTFAEMNTKPSDWGLTEILWQEEVRTVPVEVDCPQCRGRKRTHITEDGQLATKEQLSIYHNPYGAHVPPELRGKGQREVGQALGIKYGPCPVCKGPRGASRGYVVELREAKVRVGYVQWAPGTVFDSRFNHHDCQLCAKTIKVDRYRVPVTARGADDVIYGMWVGRECARKFFGIKNFKKDEFLSDQLGT